MLVAVDLVSPGLACKRPWVGGWVDGCRVFEPLRTTARVVAAVASDRQSDTERPSE